MIVLKLLMKTPLQFWEISIWLVFTAIILLLTSEIISPKYGKLKILINKKRLKNISIALGILSLLAVMINMFY